MKPFWKPESGAWGGVIFGATIGLTMFIAFNMGGPRWTTIPLVLGVCYAILAFGNSMRKL